MYNKRFFHKINDKKVLHKIGKRWAVLSVSLLGALGLTGMVTSHAHANRVDDDTPNSASVNNQQVQPAQTKLVSAAQPSQPEKANVSNDASNHEATDPNEIQEKAGVLHQQILTNGIQTIGRHHSSNVTAQQASNNGSNVTSPDQRQLDCVVTGQWGTAPFKFDPTSGVLQTTSNGTIAPVNNLSQVPLNEIKSIQFAPGTVAPVNSSKLFAAGYDSIYTTDGPSDGVAYVSQLRNLKKIDLSNLDTSKVTNMAEMFTNDSDLQSINFGPHFDTQNVEAMAGMFESDSKLHSLDLSQFNTANVLDMDSMFQSDYALSDLNLGPNFNTQYTVYVYGMFRSDNALKHLDLGNKFSTNYVIDNPSLNNHGFLHMFTNDYNLSSLNLGPNFNTQNATNFSDMFANDSDLPALNLGQKFSTAQATNLHNLFKGDSALKYLNLGSNFDTTLANAQNYKGKSSDKDPYGIPNVTVQYHGADGIFAGDNQLNTLVMNNARLTSGVDLSSPSRMHWYVTNNNVAQGQPANLTNGQRYTGTYSLYTDVPVVTTVLNYVDDANHNMVVNRVPIEGLKGDPVSYGTVVNRIKGGYQLDIPFKDYMMTFPNLPFKYQSGDVTINVKPVMSQAKQDYNNESAASYAAKGASEADSRIAKYYQNSVLASVKTANQQLADSAAKSADQRIDNSIANSAASSADRSLDSSIANSAAQSADQSLDSSIAQSAAHSADLKIQQSIAASYASSADQQIEASERASVASSQMAKSGQNSFADLLSALGQQITLSEVIAQLEAKPSVVKPTQVSASSQSATSQPAKAGRKVQRKEKAMIHDNNDRNAPVNRLRLRHKLMIGKNTVTRTPVRSRKIRLKRRCVVHGRLVSVGHVRDVSMVLKRGTKLRIEKKFKISSGHKSVDSYEIRAGDRQFFVTAGELFPTNVNIQPKEFRHYPVYGKARHRYYRVNVLKTCFTYKHGRRNKRLRRGSIIHVKGIIFTGRKGHRKEYLMLTNGQRIAASRKNVKLI